MGCCRGYPTASCINEVSDKAYRVVHASARLSTIYHAQQVARAPAAPLAMRWLVWAVIPVQDQTPLTESYLSYGTRQRHAERAPTVPRQSALVSAHVGDYC